jgi:purine nucleosidase
MRLIIDTDTAGDDSYSLLLAMLTPGTRLEAVTVCVGNVSFDQQVENALATIETAGFSGRIPVYNGARRPLVRSWEPSTMHGDDGMSCANLPIARQRPEHQHAVDAIIERVMAEPGQIDIPAQAPLTNIALAVIKEPRIAQATRHLWIMGGTDNAVGNITPCAEYNFFIDPEAARIVFEAGFAITLSTWTLTMRSGLFRREQLDELFAMDTPLSNFYRKVSRVPRETAKARYGEEISTHPDSLTCACVLNPALIAKARDAVVRIETAGEITRGLSAVHPPRLGTRWPDYTVNARVIEEASNEGFFEMMKQMLGTVPA